MQPLTRTQRVTAGERAAGPIPLWNMESEGAVPVLATAIHAGHAVLPELGARIALSEAERLREEDPGTDHLADLGTSRVVVHRSRFEVDLNRSPEGALYAGPEAAWGLDLWGESGPPAEVVEAARGEYEAFYAAVEAILEEMTARWGRVAVYDLHSYNHRRSGPAGPPDDPAGAPEINVGTGGLDRERWAPVVERFNHDLHQYPFFGRHLDVRENVRFQGGYFPRWVAQRFPESACPLAIEVKKVYVDEWTGRERPWVVDELRRALASTLPGVTQALRKVDGRGSERGNGGWGPS